MNFTVVLALIRTGVPVFGLRAIRLLCGLGINVPEANKGYFFILGHFFSHDLHIGFQDFFAFCLLNPDFSAKASMSSALFMGIYFND